MSQHIFLKRNGETTGPFSLAQIRTMWGAGHVTSDSQWKEGFDGIWQTFELLEAKIAPEPPPIPTTSSWTAPAPAIEGPKTAKKRRMQNPVGGGCALQGLAIVCFVAAISTFMTIVGPIVFGLAGIWLFFYGRSKTTWWECTRCASKLESEAARVCPRCGAEFTLGSQ